MLFVHDLRLRLGAQLHDRAVDEVVQPIVREERLSLRDLYLVGTTLPDAFVVRCDGVFQCCTAGLNGLESLHEAVRRIEGVVGALTAV
jgi:hypothetical protein